MLGETIWAIGTDDTIYHSSGQDFDWFTIEGKLVQMDVGPDGRVWGVNKLDEIFTRPGIQGAWEKIDGKLCNIAVGPSGEVWGVNKGRNIYMRNGLNDAWKQMDGVFVQVSVGPDGMVWAQNHQGKMFYRQGVADQWHAFEGKVSLIYGGMGILNAIDQAGNIWMYDRQRQWKQDTMNSKFEKICTKSSGLVGYCQNKLYLRSGMGPWQMLNKAPLNIKWIA